MELLRTLVFTYILQVFNINKYPKVLHLCLFHAYTLTLLRVYEVFLYCERQLNFDNANDIQSGCQPQRGEHTHTHTRDMTHTHTQEIKFTHTHEHVRTHSDTCK